MNDSIQQPTSLPEVLLGYLQLQGALPWPGADGLTVDEVLAAYPGAAHLGRVPGLEQLCRRHPELAGAAAAFFRRLLSTAAGLPAGKRRRRPLSRAAALLCCVARTAEGQEPAFSPSSSFSHRLRISSSLRLIDRGA